MADKTNKLEEVEKLRQKLVQEIIEITGLTIEDISVEISFSSALNTCDDLIEEAKDLDWYPDQYKGSAWYTSEKPLGGSTIVFTTNQGND